MRVFTPLVQKGNMRKVVAISAGMGDTDFVTETNVLFRAP